MDRPIGRDPANAGGTVERPAGAAGNATASYPRRRVLPGEAVDKFNEKFGNPSVAVGTARAVSRRLFCDGGVAMGSDKQLTAGSAPVGGRETDVDELLRGNPRTRYRGATECGGRRKGRGGDF